MLFTECFSIADLWIQCKSPKSTRLFLRNLPFDAPFLLVLQKNLAVQSCTWYIVQLSLSSLISEVNTGLSKTFFMWDTSCWKEMKYQNYFVYINLRHLVHTNQWDFQGRSDQCTLCRILSSLSAEVISLQIGSFQSLDVLYDSWPRKSTNIWRWWFLVLVLMILSLIAWL